MPPTDPIGGDEDESLGEKLTPESWSIFIAALVMGLIIGGLAALATANLGIVPFAFLICWVGGIWFLNKKRLPSEAIGSGCYITALLITVTPPLFYIPLYFEGVESETAEGTNMAIGSLVGLVVYGSVLFLFAIVVAAIGYFLKRRAGKKLEDAAVSPS